MDEPPAERTELARLTALHRAGIAVVRQRDVTDVMTTVIQELAQTLGYHYVSVYLWDAPLLRLQAQQGYVTPVVESPPTRGVVGRVFRTGESALITDPATDPLTGVLNRAALLTGIEGALTEAAASGRTMALLFVDLDHFKALNDRHGHQVGDAVLQRCAERMQALLPDGGLLGRYGGEEFVLLVTDPTGEAGMLLAEQLRAAIAATGQAGERDAVAVTVSIGMAQYPGDAAEVEGLLRAADQALYQAKAAGRNRVQRAGAA